jgi:hypothetical protein
LCRPREDGPREFYVQAEIASRAEDGAGPFLDEAAAFGHRLLCHVKDGLGDDAELYPLYRSLFRNRHAGQHRVRRRFNAPADFFALAQDRPPEPLIPGLDVDPSPFSDERSGNIQRTCFRVLRTALDQGSEQDTSPGRCAFDLVRSALEGVTATGVRTRPGEERTPVEIHELPGRTRLDHLLVGGLCRQPSSCPWPATANIVRASLLHEIISQSELNQALGSSDLRLRFRQRMIAAAAEKSPVQFDRWLGHRRADSFQSLLGRKALKGLTGQEARRIGRGLHAELLWAAYERMARCYGVVMLVALGDLRSQLDPPLSDEEQWLFCQRHQPKWHLGCLPLGFLGVAQQRWCYPTLSELWQRKEWAPEAYERVTQMLALFAAMVDQRREADRNRKRASARTHRRREHDRPDATSPADQVQEPVQEITSRVCGECGCTLSLVESLGGEPGVFVDVRLRCPHCDTEENRRLTMATLMALAGESAVDGPEP